MLKQDRLEKLIAISEKRYGLQIKADWRYEQFFNFLQISPSYLQAHNIAIGKIDRSSIKLAKDFDVVEKTYTAFGEVWNTDFWAWWVKRAQYQFGISATPTIHQIAKVEVRETATDRMLTNAQIEIEQYLLADRLAEGMPASMIIALPLHGDRKQIVKQFTDMLDKVYDAKAHKRGIAAYQVTRNKMREQTLKNAMRVLRARSALPNKKLFQIGNRSKISPAYVTDESKPMFDYDKRRLMEILTSRQLHFAYLLAEHAARGVFPSIDKLPEDEARATFDYVVLQRQFRNYMKWLEGEIARMKGKLAKQTSKNM
jgi:hypothetical protein